VAVAPDASPVELYLRPPPPEHVRGIGLELVRTLDETGRWVIAAPILGA
jgi:hypothetical protein